MRKITSILLFCVTLGLLSCDSDDSQHYSALNGRWVLTGAEGGFGGGYVPVDSLGFTESLFIEYESSMEIVVDDSSHGSFSFKVEPYPSEPDLLKVTFINLLNEDSTYNDPVFWDMPHTFYWVRANDSTLQVEVAGVSDGFTYIFEKKR